MINGWEERSQMISPDILNVFALTFTVIYAHGTLRNFSVGVAGFCVRQKIQTFTDTCSSFHPFVSFLIAALVCPI